MVCKLFSWMAAGCTTIATFHLLLVSLDRVLSIKVPVYYDTHVKFGKAQFKIRNISFAFSAVLFFCSASNMAHTSIQTEFGFCGLVYSTTFESAMLFTTIMVGQFAPFVALLLSNFIFSISLLTRRAPSQTAGQNGTGASALSITRQDEPREAIIEKDYVRMLFLFIFLVLQNREHHSRSSRIQ